jgi:hypothetical protein
VKWPETSTPLRRDRRAENRRRKREPTLTFLPHVVVDWRVAASTGALLPVGATAALSAAAAWHQVT